MNFDSHQNFAYSAIATPPSPANSGASLAVRAGEGSLFPAAPFNAVVWPAGASPLFNNAEIVRVTGKSGDVFSISRSQEGSSARSIVVGDQIAAAITVKTITDLEQQSAPPNIHWCTASTIPADGDIATGDLWIWFDATNGAAKFGMKGKQLDGTVINAGTPVT